MGASMRDILGVSISVLCLLHCMAPLVFLAFGASWGLHELGHSLHHEILHLVFLLPVIVLLAVSLPKGYLTHRNFTPSIIAVAGITLLVVGIVVGGVAETTFTISGSAFVIFSHLLNRRNLKNLSAVTA